MEHEPENDLFETAHAGGLGEAHLGRATCDLCGRIVNPQAETEEDPDEYGDQWYRQLVIGRLVILDCCFPKIEALVLHLAQSTNMLPWLAEQLAAEADKQRAQEEATECRSEAASTLATLLGKR